MTENDCHRYFYEKECGGKKLMNNIMQKERRITKGDILLFSDTYTTIPNG